MKLNKYLLVVFVTILAGFIRFYDLGRYPVSLNWDEVSHGYNAFSILKTGADEWGKTFPLIFRAYGDYKLPVYIYFSIIPIWLFGLTSFAVRFVSALAGTLAVPGIYLLVRELFPHQESSKINMPALSSFFLAILPWHFFLSRPALEANLALALIIYGFYYLLRFFKGKSSLLPAVILLGLSLHTYNTSRVFVPLFIILSFLVFRPKLKINLSFVFSFLLTMIFSGLVLYQIYGGEGTARYEKLKILSPYTVFQLGEKRAASSLPPLLAKLTINRPLYFTTTFGKNYLSYFTPAFFFQSWGAQYQFAIPYQNLLTIPLFILAIFGFFVSLNKIKTPNYTFIYLWLLLSPVAASLTLDPPQAIRPSPMIPALVIFAVFGLSFLTNLFSEKKQALFLWTSIIFVVISFAAYAKKYLTTYRVDYSDSWQYGYSQVAAYVKNRQKDYSHVFITKRYGEPHLFYSFYTSLSPRELQPGGDNIRFSKSDWYWTDKIGQVYFINDWQITTDKVTSLPLESGGMVSTQNSLLITSPSQIPANAKVLETINFLDGRPAFIITSIP